MDVFPRGIVVLWWKLFWIVVVFSLVLYWYISNPFPIYKFQICEKLQLGIENNKFQVDTILSIKNNETVWYDFKL